MTESESKIIAESIYKLAEAVKGLASAIEDIGGISEDEPLNWSLSRELAKIANAIAYNDPDR